MLGTEYHALVEEKTDICENNKIQQTTHNYQFTEFRVTYISLKIITL